MFLNEKAAVNNKLDRYAKNWSIQVYGNEHGLPHMELRISGVSYFVYIPTVEEWSNNETFKIYITETKPNTLPSKYMPILIDWANDTSIFGSDTGFTNLEWCRKTWNYRNKDNTHKNLFIFPDIKDISTSTKNTLNIGDIEIEVIKQSKDYIKFIYNNSTYEYKYGYVSHIEGDKEETDFLQNSFENNY